jgi:hypothetical protein
MTLTLFPRLKLSTVYNVFALFSFFFFRTKCSLTV